MAPLRPPTSFSPVLKPLFLDFLAPRLAAPHLFSRRPYSTPSTTPIPDDHASQTPSLPQTPPTPKKRLPLSASQRAYLDSALRVNQAGELAAVRIYNAQIPLITRTHPHLRPLMQHMLQQEEGHLKLFNSLITKHRIRPSAFTPLWRVASTALGYGTALLSKEAAMACTEAVETEIGEHYNEQVREMLSWVREAESQGADVEEGIRELLGEVRRVRDEELEHLDEAVDEDAKLAEGYPVLTAVIRGGCKGAIWLTERI